MNKKNIKEIVNYIQYILTYGLQKDVTEEEIERCEMLMEMFLTTETVQIAKGDKK